MTQQEERSLVSIPANFDTASSGCFQWNVKACLLSGVASFLIGLDVGCAKW